MSRLLELATQSAAQSGWRGRRDRALIELLYSAGLRLSETHALNAANVDLTGGRVKVHGKGRKQRIVPIGRHAVSALRAYGRERQRRFGAPTRPRIRSSYPTETTVCRAARSSGS